MHELATILGMERAEAARFWLGCAEAALPFCHQELATLTVKLEGSPDGEPVILPYSDERMLEHLGLVSDDELEPELADAELSE